jgi:hypothetical protein
LAHLLTLAHWRLVQHFSQLAQPMCAGYKLNPYPFHENHVEQLLLAVSRSLIAAKYLPAKPVTSEIFLVVSWLISLG